MGWNVGICGTFDVENYGDLLFPLLAEAELAQRLGSVALHRYSYRAKTRPEWPYSVTSLACLPDEIQDLDALLIGGGFLIRFDKEVAPGYVPPHPGIHHPTGYWLTPALIALQNNVPLFWNAPGMHCNHFPDWSLPLMKLAFDQSRYISVRDEPTRAALSTLTAAPVHVIPDTAFGIPRLLPPDASPSAEFTQLAADVGLHGPYIVLQATLGQEEFIRFLQTHAKRFQGFQFLALPLGPVLGERSEMIPDDLPNLVRLPAWPAPRLIAELISRAQAVVGHSYHLLITALTCGVPAFTRQDLSSGKYSALSAFGTLYSLPSDAAPHPDWFLARVGKSAPSLAVRSAYDPIRHHWDCIAALLRQPAIRTAPALNRFWQSLPGFLENAPEKPEAPEKAEVPENVEALELQSRFQQSLSELTLARAESATHERHTAEIRASLSWRLTAPLRALGRGVMQNRSRRVLKLERIQRHRLAAEPYRWAAISGLFSAADASQLAATYPDDHFKLLSARGGEKDYEYEARNLIGMGAHTATFPEELSDVWRSLAADLLAPRYRAAMAKLTGLDLTHSPMEVNVFHYGPGCSLGAHQDLPEKLVTHVLYFNRFWNPAHGGCLSILRSANLHDCFTEVSPLVGNSAVIVRSDNSWHAVSRVANHSADSRRSVTVTFYRPGSVSSMWPPKDPTPLHRYGSADLS